MTLSESEEGNTEEEEITVDTGHKQGFGSRDLGRREEAHKTEYISL